MTPTHKLAESLRQIVVLFWLLGGLATLGFVTLLVSALGAESVDAGSVLVLVVQMLAMWIGLAWMGLVASGLAEVLAPRSPQPS